MTLNFDDLLNEHGSTSLVHYGIPGMKWGQRRGSAALARARSEINERRSNLKAPTHSDRSSVNKLKKKPKRTLSNDEIKKINNRLELEKKMSQLKIEATVPAKGSKALKAALGLGTSIAGLYALSTTPLGKAIIEGIVKKG